MWETIKHYFSRRKQGFTLIELLVVIAIIGILSAALLLANVQTNLKRARDGKRVTDLESIRSGLEIYRSENGSYPGTLVELIPDFITAVPDDPKAPAQIYFYESGNCAGIYCKTYELCAALEKTPGSGSGGCISTNQCGLVCNYRTTNP
ncbi:MAG: prepilin-type N-terminal cleavage/methylation domain-containing protein [bacterium]|nr:prepilin-type N-terminal cleavage/methylation domain-containing protein [bacterium]